MTDAVDVQLVINAALGLQIGVKVPDLTGMTEGEASGALAFAYLTVGDVTSETSATVPAGQILSQDPAAGASVAPETTVAVVLSSGPPPSTGWTYIPSQTSVWGLKIEQTSDGGYVMGGGYTGGYDMYALKLTPTGAVEWDADYSEESPNGNDLWRAEAHGLNPAGDGGYVMLSSGGFVLLKLDSQGNYVWDKSFAPDNPYTPGKPCSPTVSGELCVCSDGGFFAAGSSYVGGYFLASVLKTDAAGNLEFCRVINDNAKAYDQQIEAGQQTADGGFVISGYSENGSLHGYLALLIKLDADGLLEWSKTYQCVELGYGATSNAVTQTADGGYVLGGFLVNDITKVLNHGPFLAKTDEDGELVWMRAYGGSATVYDLRDIEETPQGDLLVCGNKSGKLILSKFNANGDLLWNFVMTELPSVVGHDLELTPDGGCIMVGNRYDDQTQNQEQDVYIVKVNGDGLIVWEREISMNDRFSTIYPNPGSQLNIRLAMQHPKAQLQLFDQAGRLILQQQLHQTESTVETSHLPSGVYLYHLSAPTGLNESGKWVKE